MTVVVIQPHVSTFPNPISFEPGQRVQLGRRDTEYGGWIFVTTADGNEGWAPEQYIASTDNPSVGIARCRYNAFELDTQLHEQLDVISELNKWYLVRNRAGQEGWIPMQTVAPAPSH